jgi:hypothetical protein
MNILDLRESKIKSFLKFLNDHGATSKARAIKIEDVERHMRMDDTLFDEITRYVVSSGFASRTAPKSIYITKQGVDKIRG